MVSAIETFSCPTRVLTHAGFQIDAKALTDNLGGDPVSAVMLEQEGIYCGLASEHCLDSSAVFFSLQRCGGTRMIISAQDGTVALPEGLNDNLNCICCFVSPTG